MEGFIQDEKDEEVEKYVIPEDMTSKEKLGYIIKRGFTIQKMAMINKIPYLVNNKELLDFTFSLILEYIEIWDDSLQIGLANAIYNLFTKNLNCEVELGNNMADSVNLVIKFCMKMISTELSNISDEYIKTLDSIVKFYSKVRKVKVDPDLVDYACNMGSFGRNISSRRFSVFFCSSLIQISEIFNQELYTRVMILSSDCERTIKLEVAYNIRFIIREFLDDKYIKHNFIRLFESYLTEDDLFLKTETIISIFLNLTKINDENYVSGVLGKISNLYETGGFNNADFTNLIKVFDFLIGEYSRLGKDIYSKQVYSIIKIFIKKYVFNKDLSNFPTPENYYLFIEKFQFIYSIFKNHPIKELNYITEILNFIFKNFNFFSILFVSNYDLILNALSSEDLINTKLLVEKFSSILTGDSQNINYVPIINSIYCELNPSNIQLIPLIAKNFDKILCSIINSNNEELINILIARFEIFTEYFNPPSNWNYPNCSNWFEFYKFLKCFSNNENLFENYEFLIKIYSFTFTLIKQADASEESSSNTNCISKNYKVIRQAFKILAIIVKYAAKNIKEEIFKYIDKEIVNNKSFYKRRYYFPFLKKSIEIFSISFLKEHLMIDYLLKFLSDYNLLIKISLIMFKKLFPLIYDDLKTKSNLEGKLEKLRGSTNDFETRKAIKEFDDWRSQYRPSDYLELTNLDKEKFKNEKILANRDINSNSPEKKDEKKKKINKKNHNLPKNNDTRKYANSIVLNQVGRENFKKSSMPQNSLNTSSTINTNTNTFSISSLRRRSFRSLEKKIFKQKETSTDQRKTSTKELIKTEYPVEKAKLIINVNNVSNVKNIRTIISGAINNTSSLTNINNSTNSVIKKKLKY